MTITRGSYSRLQAGRARCTAEQVVEQFVFHWRRHCQQCSTVKVKFNVAWRTWHGPWRRRWLTLPAYAILIRGVTHSGICILLLPRLRRRRYSDRHTSRRLIPNTACGLPSAATSSSNEHVESAETPALVLTTKEHRQAAIPNGNCPHIRRRRPRPRSPFKSARHQHQHPYHHNVKQVQVRTR